MRKRWEEFFWQGDGLKCANANVQSLGLAGGFTRMPQGRRCNDLVKRTVKKVVVECEWMIKSGRKKRLRFAFSACLGEKWFKNNSVLKPKGQCLATGL